MRFSGLGKSKILADYADKISEYSKDGLLSALKDEDVAFVKEIGKCLEKTLYDGDSELIILWEAFVQVVVNKKLDKIENNAVHKSLVAFLLTLVPKVYSARKSTLDAKCYVIGLQLGLFNIVNRSNHIYKEQMKINDGLMKLMADEDRKYESETKKPKLGHDDPLSSGPSSSVAWASAIEKDCAVSMQKLSESSEPVQPVQDSIRYVPY